MKTICSVIIALLIVQTGLRAQAPAPVADANAPVITFEADVIDYGVLKQGSEAVRTFKFTNTGSSPLVIQSIKGQCGCTSIPDSWPKGPIPPGGTGTFQVKYDTLTRIGAFDKKVTVTSNASNATVDVKIKGVVEAN